MVQMCLSNKKLPVVCRSCWWHWHKHLLFQNHYAIFKQNWHNAPTNMKHIDSRLVKWTVISFTRYIQQSRKNTLISLKKHCKCIARTFCSAEECDKTKIMWITHLTSHYFTNKCTPFCNDFLQLFFFMHYLISYAKLFDACSVYTWKTIAFWNFIRYANTVCMKCGIWLVSLFTLYMWLPEKPLMYYLRTDLDLWSQSYLI